MRRISSRSRRSERLWLLGVGSLLAILAAAEVFNARVSGWGGSGLWLSYFTVLLAFVTAAGIVAKPDASNLTSWWTFMVLLQFGVAPLVCALLEIGELDIYSVKALSYVFLGTIAFWAGARVVQSKAAISTFILDDVAGGRRRLIIGLALGVVGCLCKLYMLRAGLFFYSSDIAQVEASSRYKEWLFVLGGLTTYAQVILAIEYFNGNRDKLVRNAFYGTVGVSMVFALLSGMKGEVLVIPFLLLIVRKLVTGKVNWKLVGAVVALLVIMFPINASYRSEVQSGGAITSLSLGTSAVQRAVRSVNEDSTLDVMTASLERAANRLDLLQVIVFLEQDEGRSNIEGNERLWMIPFYPFVPRFLWEGKPVLDKGQRLSVAMGSTATSSTAVTPFGDLLILGGITAVVIGMGCVGMLIQTLTNLVTGNFGPKALLVYAILFSKFYAPEYDLMMMGTTMIQTAVIAYVLSDMVYGGRLFSYKAKPKPGQRQVLRPGRPANLVS